MAVRSGPGKLTSDFEENYAKPDAANAGATETGLVAATAPRKLLDTKRLIKSFESCKTKSEFDFESRKFNLLKSDMKIFATLRPS